MTYPNAARGVKKLCVAEILNMIAVVLGVLTAATVIVFGAVTVAINEMGNTELGGLLNTTGTLTAVFGGATFVLAAIAMILQIVGLVQARKDEASFRMALIFTIVGLGAALLIQVLDIALPLWKTAIDQIGSVIDNACNILIVVFVVQGVSNLAEEIGDETLVRRGELIRSLVIFMLTMSIIANLIGTTFVFVGGTVVTFANVPSIVASILSVVYYIIYIVFLSRAKNVLAKA